VDEKPARIGIERKKKSSNSQSQQEQNGFSVSGSAE
jgi:hypothetical protein